MSWSRSVSCLISAGLAVGACKPAPSWQLLGESTRLARAANAPTRSAIFDGQTLGLRGARGETLGVQLRISDARERRARLLLPEQVARVSAFVARSLHVSEPSSAMYGSSSGVGDYPDVLIASGEALKTGELGYFDVAISE